MHGHHDPRLARSRVEFSQEPPAAERQRRSSRVATQSLWRHLRDAIASGGLSLIVRKID